MKKFMLILAILCIFLIGCNTKNANFTSSNTQVENSIPTVEKKISQEQSEEQPLTQQQLYDLPIVKEAFSVWRTFYMSAPHFEDRITLDSDTIVRLYSAYADYANGNEDFYYQYNMNGGWIPENEVDAFAYQYFNVTPETLRKNDEIQDNFVSAQSYDEKKGYRISPLPAVEIDKAELVSVIQLDNHEIVMVIDCLRKANLLDDLDRINRYTVTIAPHKNSFIFVKALTEYLT